MLPRGEILAWRVDHAPWADEDDVEQDLLLTRALCDGFWSGVGDHASFRGKVSVAVVERETGASLLAEWIPPEEVRGIAAALELRDPIQIVEASQGDAYPVSGFEVGELRRFFHLCAELRLGLIGWA